MGASILIGIQQQGNIKPQILPWIHSWSKNPNISIVSNNFQPYEKNLNRVLNQAQEINSDYVLLLDHDNIPKRDPLELIKKVGPDIIGCPYPNYYYDNGKLEIVWMVYDLYGDKYVPRKQKKFSGLEEVEAVASGCLLINKKVIQSGLRFEWIHDEVGEIQLGLDLNFCEKAKEKGFKVFTHWDYICDHIKERSLLEILKWKNQS